jgi:hypothetical protein
MAVVNQSYQRVYEYSRRYQLGIFAHPFVTQHYLLPRQFKLYDYFVAQLFSDAVFNLSFGSGGNYR